MPYLGALALTIAIELPIVAALVPAPMRPRALVDGLALNLCTHPLAWLAVLHLGLGWWLVEAAVTLTELALYRGLTRLSWRRAAIVACAANGATAALSCLF
jgi:hypothetical protein